MSVLVYAESLGGRCKKVALEAVTYGRKTADQLGQSCHVLTIGQTENAAKLGTYGADSIQNIPLDWAHLDDKIYSQLIADVANQLDAQIVILSHTSTGKNIAGRIAVKLNAALISGANTLPSNSLIDRTVFSGKAIASCGTASKKQVISVMGNAIVPEAVGTPGTVETLAIEVPASDVELVEVKTQSGSVPLPEAELVVSGGRGFKGPENWGILLELAEALGAATACSRPVADSDWRPHHEHVGQTGVAIRPNLYVAIGISGAIQHLGGVNNSKTIVVINKDPEAPFFKAADYGVVGDLFEVVPRLTEAVKRYQAASK